MHLVSDMRTAASLAKRLIRAQARQYVCKTKSLQEKEPGPFTRLVGVEDDFEAGAREAWEADLGGWDLSQPAERERLRSIILSVVEEALNDARRSFPYNNVEGGVDDLGRLIDEFAEKFDPNSLLHTPRGTA